jgi:hypothetical protein
MGDADRLVDGPGADEVAVEVDRDPDAGRRRAGMTLDPALVRVERDR